MLPCLAFADRQHGRRVEGGDAANVPPSGHKPCKEVCSMSHPTDSPSLFNPSSTSLFERYRPACWADVLGQAKIVGTIQRLAKAGSLGGRAYWLSGNSGTGKTTIARLLAAEIADEFHVEELDSSDLTPARLRDIEQAMQLRGWGKGGKAFIVNEAHGLRKDAIRQLLVLLERLPGHAAFIFTTTS